MKNKKLSYFEKKLEEKDEEILRLKKLIETNLKNYQKQTEIHNLEKQISILKQKDSNGQEELLKSLEEKNKELEMSNDIINFLKEQKKESDLKNGL